MQKELTHLFTPYRMKNTVIKNRLVRSPMESSLGFPDGLVTNDHLRMYRTAAEGGVGLMIMEGVAVHPISKMTDAQMVAFGDENIPGFKQLANTIHAHGDGIIVWAQLYCGGAASFGYSYGQDDYGLDVNSFREELIEDILNSYANAALILKKSGFDGVEIHGGHGYLVSQFLSPAVNRRADKWGGTLEKRMVFPLEILYRIRKLCGEEFPIGIKMNVADYLPGGHWLGDTTQIARKFALEGFDFIEASGGMGFMTELREALRSKMGNHEYYFGEAIPAFKKALAGTGAALCVTGGIGSPQRMEEMLSGGVDFIGLARPWLTEPDLANRIKAGDHRDTRCVSREHICNLCLTRLALGPVTCYKFFPGYCKMECPIDQDAPEYIGQIARQNFEEAFRLVIRDNPLPHSLCRICNHKCEDVCRGKTGEPLAIRELKRFAVEYGNANSLWKQIKNPVIPIGKKVAIIGSGPAGLSCAWSLVKRGYSPTIFEKENHAGGTLNSIPRFRLPAEDLQLDIGNIVNQGVNLELNKELGKDFTLESLDQDGFAAVFIAIGATKPVGLKVPGFDLKGVYTGLDFLSAINSNKKISIGARVLVLGGGSVAVDSAMSALRMGADSVSMVCLECREDMPAEYYEIEDALEEGIDLHCGWGLQEISGSDIVDGARLVSCTAVFNDSGRFSPQYDTCTMQYMEADTIILAIGQKTDWNCLDYDSKSKLCPEGHIKADPITLQTTMQNIFVGGDSYTGPKTVVEAAKAGKDAAESIDRFLRGVSLYRTTKDDSYEPFFKGVACYTDPSDQIKKTSKSLRAIPVKLDPETRKRSFDEIYSVISADQAVHEARRCLKYDLELEAESKARYADMGKAQIDFRRVDGEEWPE